MNLTKTSGFFKAMLKVLGVFVVLYYVLAFFIIPKTKVFVQSMLKTRNPPVPTFGMLDQLEFVEKPINGKAPTYILNTKSGGLPETLPYKLPVYKTKKTQFSYLAGKNASDDAAFLGFTDADLITDLKGTEYKWRSLKTGGILDIQTDTKELILNTNIPQNSSSIDTGNLTEVSAKTAAINLFTKTNRFDDTYQNGSQEVTLGTINENSIEPVFSSRDVQVAKVELFRQLDSYKVVNPDIHKGLLHVILKNTTQTTPLNYPIVEAHYMAVIMPPTASYPLIDVTEAWKAVKNGKGVISSIVPKTANPFEEYIPVPVESIFIDTVYLAYYETPKRQDILQPIYVFQGFYTTQGSQGGEITIYFPAITAEWVKPTK